MMNPMMAPDPVPIQPARAGSAEGKSDERNLMAVPELKSKRVRFAHPSEAEFARILDFYQIPWEYEPHTFPLRWSKDGRVIESFSPDFYLPETQQHIEITTCRQRLVTKKNRKLRNLRALYPEVKIILLYNRDFHNLMWKYRLNGTAPAP